MADDIPPPKPTAAMPKMGLGSMLEGLRVGLAGGDAGAVDASSAAIREVLQRYPVRPATTAEIIEQRQRDLEPAVAGSADGKKPPRKPSKRTSLDRIPGRRPMKEYAVSGEELLTLGILQGGTALFLAFAGACFGFYLSVRQTVDFADKNVSEATVGWWSGMGDAAFYLAIAAALLGLVLAGLSGLKVFRIMRTTDHG